MNSEFYEKKYLFFPGSDAIAILNTPDEGAGCADRSREEFTDIDIRGIV